MCTSSYNQTDLVIFGKPVHWTFSFGLNFSVSSLFAAELSVSTNKRRVIAEVS